MRGSARQTGDNTWEFRVGAGRDPATGRHKQARKTWTGSKRELKKALRDFVDEVELDRGISGGSTQKFSQLLDRWLAQAESDLSPTTVYTYRGYIRREIEPSLGDIQVGRLTAHHFDTLYQKLKARGMAPASIRQVHAICRKALAQGKRWGWVTDNVAMLATPPSVRRAALSMPTAQVAGLIVAKAKEADRVFGMFVEVALLTGARRGELCALRWPDVDLAQGTIVFSRSMAEVPGVRVEKDTKTHAARAIAIDPGLVADLKEYRGWLERRARDHGEKLVPAGFVFPANGQRPSLTGKRWLRPDFASQQWRALAKEMGVSARLHDARHLHATQLLANRVDVRTVSGRLGHAKASTTLDIYGHFVPAADREAAEVIAGVLAPRPISGSI